MGTGHVPHQSCYCVVFALLHALACFDHTSQIALFPLHHAAHAHAHVVLPLLFATCDMLTHRRLRDAGAGSMPAVPGISTTSDRHFDTRSECVAALQRHFSGMAQLPQRSVWHRPLHRLSPLLDALCGLLPFRGGQGCSCAMRRLRHLQH